MANTINDLYLKYANKVGRTLENDRYFQYLYEMVQAGNNELVQNSRILRKIVDERWLTTIEEALDSINTIIEKPRRFVTTSEEVVPVDLAKKITADSVRHLSMNTQFIASNENGDVHPTRILNVTTEETYDLYENRFIYHLIQRLVTFIDKRTDIIFWSTGDETTNTMTYTSKVDDAYEEIQYKIEMTVKNRQSFAENDNDNMSVFMRIDRVRRLVLALRNSSFCSIMAGCAKVRSPIQRTNLIMKDPHYRTCYKLWQFLESYDEVGYTIEEEDTALAFDEEYLIQMYTGLITNYAVFKSILEGDERNLDKVMGKKRRTIKPKFVKKYQEEIVDDRNIEEVEIRRVFLEEVTQAQLDAEAKLAETEARKAELEQELEDLDSQMIMLQQQINALNFQLNDANMALADMTDAKEDLELKVAEETENRVALEEMVQTLTDEKGALETRVESEVEARAVVEAERDAALQNVESAKAETAQMKVEAEAERAARVKAEEDAKALVEKTAKDAADKIQAAVQDADDRIARTKAETDAKVAEIQTSSAQEIQSIKDFTEKEIQSIRESSAQEIAQIQNDAAAKVADANNNMMRARREAADAVTKMEQESKEHARKLEAQMNEQIAAAKAEAEAARDQAIAQAEATLKASADAEIAKAKAEAAQMSEEKYVMEQLLNQARETSVASTERAKQAEADAADSKVRANNAEQAKEQAEKNAALSDAKAKEAAERAEAAEKKASEEQKAREKAEAKAEAKTLQHYIVNALNERNERKRKDD